MNKHTNFWHEITTNFKQDDFMWKGLIVTSLILIAFYFIADAYSMFIN